ncbi:hypothetical protein PUN28_005620 [Cardiocondyla obscurior]
MAWFGDSLSNLKGQLTNLTKEVLSDGIVHEIDDRAKALKEANERCSQLQDLLTAKDAEISLLRRQNCELQRTVIEINAKSKESKDVGHADEAEGTFWDPSCIDNRNARNQSHVHLLQEQLAQAAVKVRELECELKHVQKVNSASFKDDISDGHQKAEVVRAKQDMLNRIIQMEEKTREAERNAKHIQLDEASLINDFRSVISKLNSCEKFDLIRGALKALQIENETYEKIKAHKKANKELEKADGFEYNSIPEKHANSQQDKLHETAEELSINKEETLQKKIEELQNENKDLVVAMEKLDEEHAQSIEKLLSLKEESNKKHRSLQNAYEQLSIDYNEAQKKIIELRNDMSKRDESTCTETIHQSIQTDNVNKLDRHIQVISAQEISETNPLDDITEKVKKILKNCTIRSIESEESFFEALAKQYVDAKWKLDVLERKVTEISRDLKETEEIKNGLQMECEELQSHVDALLLEKNMRVKPCQNLDMNLPSIPEASDERAASLEMDVESLQEEVNRLLTENEMIRGTNATLLAVQSNQVPLTNNEESQGDKNSKLYSYVQENIELPIALEKKSSSGDTTPNEKSKLDHENIKEELTLSVSKIKVLEINLASLQDTINNLTEENKDLLQKNKYLDTQLHDKLLQERNMQEENNYLLENLQEQLNTTIREKIDLENDNLNKEKELEAMQIQIDMKRSEIVKLCQDNDRLIKENVSLSEQLNATHDESFDKIELLNTEMSLLQQEHEDLKQEASIYKEELPVLKEKLYKAQECYTELENKYYALKLQNSQLELHKKDIQSPATEIDRRGNELDVEEPVTEELSLLRNKCEFLEREIETLRKEAHKFKKNVTEISLVNIDKTGKEEELLTAEDNLSGIENVVTDVEAEKQDCVTKNAKHSTAFNETHVLQSVIDKERREKDVIKAQNESLMNEIDDLRSKFQTTCVNNKESAKMAKRTIENLSCIIREKDQKINSLQGEIAHMKNTISQSLNDLAAINNQKSELEQLVSIKHNEILQYQNEIQKLIQRVNEQAAHIQEFISERTANEMRNKANAEDIKNEHDHNGIDYSRQSAEIATLNKKCDALEAALMQEQSNSRLLQNQLVEIQNKEANSAKELDRLRTHLVEMESSYTDEVLIAEKNRQELEAKLLQAEEKVKSSSTAFTSANIRANQQVETLQQQIALITQQRDQIQAKLSTAEDNIQLQSASLTNLQIVLEQFQQDKERDVMVATEKLRSRLTESHEKQEKLLDDISNLQQQLREARECLKAASRLSEQLEKKDEQIERCNEEVAQLKASLDLADQKMKEAREHVEGKIDKVLVKNLLLGYLSSAKSDKSSILRVFANVLEFTESEKEKTGLNNATTHGSRQVSGTSSKDHEASLSTAFVRFLESESKPKPQLPGLPIGNSPSSRPGYHKQSSPSSSSSSSTQSTLLLPNVALPTFPDFIPARNTGSILKEVLKDS